MVRKFPTPPLTDVRPTHTNLNRLFPLFDLNIFQCVCVCKAWCSAQQLCVCVELGVELINCVRVDGLMLCLTTVCNLISLVCVCGPHVCEGWSKKFLNHLKISLCNVACCLLHTRFVCTHYLFLQVLKSQKKVFSYSNNLTLIL